MNGTRYNKMVDKFYTKKCVAQKCLDTLGAVIPEYPKEFDIILEPSAGAGNFLELLPEDKSIGIDIEPENDSVLKQDFLTEFRPEENKRYAVVGNPPFGRVSSLAIKFFNRASQFADIIAFIVPRTFKRISVQNKLSMDFTLVYSEDLPLKPCAFTPCMSAKCCFQIWKRMSKKRIKVILETSHPDFKFVGLGPKDAKNQPTVPSSAEIAVKAYGSNCGYVIRDKSRLQELRPKSWHWIRTVENGPSIQEIIDIIEKMDFSISEDTVRQNSIGRGEFVLEYSRTLQRT